MSNASTLETAETTVAPQRPALITTTEPRLTAMDRCDACQAQAYIAATVNGSELLYCAHHGRKYAEKLRAVATTWHDETHRLDGENRTQGEP